MEDWASAARRVALASSVAVFSTPPVSPPESQQSPFVGPENFTALVLPREPKRFQN